MSTDVNIEQDVVVNKMWEFRNPGMSSGADYIRLSHLPTRATYTEQREGHGVES